ncbi:ADP-ribosylation [Dentipellis sp. KUC8613]|nr:ADP-ribosylation [Dentipellis sp. KUC8613]
MPLTYPLGQYLPVHYSTQYSEPQLVQLNATDPRWRIAQQLFVDGWEHTHKERKRVINVFEITHTRWHMSAYESYRSRVGFEYFHFHGTNRACMLGETGITPCTLPQCSLCSIIRNSFKIEKSGTKNGFQRFGRGIYSTPVSSKADDYTKNLATYDTPLVSAMILSRISLGHIYATYRDNKTLNSAPAGHDSVYGVRGIDLNYDESVVYSNDAIRPAFLVTYTSAW